MSVPVAEAKSVSHMSSTLRRLFAEFCSHTALNEMSALSKRTCKKFLFSLENKQGRSQAKTRD